MNFFLIKLLLTNYIILERRQYVSLIVLGDFGTGKTVILDAGAEMCSQDENIQVHCISALDYPLQNKRAEDVLDVANRLRFENTRVKFQNIVSLR